MKTTTLYEYFEAWLTTEEWKNLKRGMIKYFITYDRILPREAITKRDTILNRKMYPIDELQHEQEEMFCELISSNLWWRRTPQGYAYWQDIHSRTRPIRTL